MEGDDVCTCWMEGHDGIMADCDMHRPEDDQDPQPR